MNAPIIAPPTTADGLPPTPVLIAQSRQWRHQLAAAIAQSQAARTPGGDR